MDEEKKKRLQELASQEAYEEECRQTKESDFDFSDGFQNTVQIDSEKTQIYETGEKIGRFLYNWKEALIVGICILMIVLIVIIAQISSATSSAKTEEPETAQSNTEQNDTT